VGADRNGIAALLTLLFLVWHSRVAEDKFAWLRDDEFARQALAGINPVNIERLQVSKAVPLAWKTPTPWLPKQSYSSPNCRRLKLCNPSCIQWT
jgi:hypothetical protein